MNKIIKKHIKNGVVFINPNTTTIDESVRIEAGATILPGCYIHGNTTIGKNALVGPNSELCNAILEEDVKCTHSVIYDSRICKGATVGPFAHLRMNTVVGENDRIGNFVEIKKSTIGEKTNVSHLTYIGDTLCGSYVNWGCGCVTVNYDGKNKSQTTIGDSVFIGCNSNLIAPVIIESNTFIAAGSTITHDVKSGDMAIARAKQVNKEGYANNYEFKRKPTL